MVLEAKDRIAARRALRKAYYQAKSYALRLQGRMLLLAALDGLWLFGGDSEPNHFTRRWPTRTAWPRRCAGLAGTCCFAIIERHLPGLGSNGRIDVARTVARGVTPHLERCI